MNNFCHTDGQNNLQLQRLVMKECLNEFLQYSYIEMYIRLNPDSHISFLQNATKSRVTFH